MIIRKAQIQDIPQIENLLFQVNKVHSDERPDIFKQGTKKYTKNQLIELLSNETKPIFVAENNNIILGYVFLILQNNSSGQFNNFKTLYIDDLCVAENSRGQKIGKKLFNFAFDYAKQNNCYNLTLNVWALNKSAIKFYEKCGMCVQKLGLEKIILN